MFLSLEGFTRLPRVFGQLGGANLSPGGGATPVRTFGRKSVSLSEASNFGCT